MSAICRARCIACDGPVRVFMGKAIDEVRQEVCPKCGKRLTVIGHEEQPPAAVTKPPADEVIGLSKERRAHVDSVSRTLVLSAFEGKQP